MQDSSCSPQAAASSLHCSGKAANDKDCGSCGMKKLCLPRPREGGVFSEDYVQMLLHTIRTHDAEKLSLLQRIEDCVKPEQAEVQRLRREASERSQEVAQLQRDLSETRLMLQQERERANCLVHENTILLAQAEDDRAKLALFLQKQQQRSKLPQSSTTSAAAAQVGGCGKGTTMSLRRAARAFSSSAATSEEDREISRSAPQLTSPLVAALEEKARALQELLDAQRAAYENEQTRQTHVERERTRQHVEEVERYIAAIDRLHALHRVSLADLIRTRHDMQIEQRGLRENIEKLTAALNKASEALEAERRRHAADLLEVQRRTGDNFCAITRRLRQELGERQALTVAEREQHTSLLAGCEAEIERLAEALKTEKKRRRRVEERYRLEVDGMNSEVSLMRQALRAMEKRVYFSHGRCF